MEETIGECTNIHITYPALVLGYFAVVRANRTLKDALEARESNDDSIDDDDAADTASDSSTPTSDLSSADTEQIKANDIAILEDGSVSDGLVRFHSALSEMTHRRGVRNEISRYEAMALALIEPKGAQPGAVYGGFPANESPLHMSRFFSTLYQRYDERFVFGAPLLADRQITTRFQWSPGSPVFTRSAPGATEWPSPDYDPRLRRV